MASLAGLLLKVSNDKGNSVSVQITTCSLCWDCYSSGQHKQKTKYCCNWVAEAWCIRFGFVLHLLPAEGKLCLPLEMAVLHTEEFEHPFSFMNTDIIKWVIMLKRVVSKTALHSCKTAGKRLWHDMQRKALAYNFVHGPTNPDAADLSSCVRKGLLAKIQSTQETSQPLLEVNL